MCCTEKKVMFNIPGDICKKILNECEKYQFSDRNKLRNYNIFRKVFIMVWYDHQYYYHNEKLNAVKKIIIYLFGTLNEETNTICLNEPIDAIIPEEVNDYSLGSFRKYNHPGKNNNKFCINCINCENCIGCIDCTNCRKCKKCRCVYECEECQWCEGCKNCEKCFKCTFCNDCELCRNCVGVGNPHFGSI